MVPTVAAQVCTPANNGQPHQLLLPLSQNKNLGYSDWGEAKSQCRLICIFLTAKDIDH